MRNTLFLLVVLIACAVPQIAGAQEFPAPGSRVRVTTPQETVSGRLDQLGAETVVVDGRSFRRGSLVRFEVSQGRRSRWLVGGGIGLAAGAVATYVITNTGGSTAPCNRSANQDAIGAGGCAALVAAGGVAGGLIGALVGAQFHSERWMDVAGMRLQVRPAPGGLALGASIRF